MNDDIVTRLRNLCVPDDSKWLESMPTDRLMLEAADEIERLREWKELAYQMRNKYWWAMLGKTLSQFDDMHKADWALPHNVALRQQLKRDAR